MTTTTGNTPTTSPADQGRTRHVLLSDGQDRLTLRRLRPWHRMLARCAAARLDRELAAGASPETSATFIRRACRCAGPGSASPRRPWPGWPAT